MTDQTNKIPAQNRFDWLDAMKGFAILWIVLFHFCSMNDVFKSYPWVLGPAYVERLLAATESLAPLEKAVHLIRGAFVALVELGFHGVGIFLIASGFGLSYSLAKTGGPTEGWRSWYGKRLIRLFPMYWVAHLIFLVSPFVFRPESIDYRFFLSLLGIRVFPLDMTFYYANPAWWFFTLLIQLYLAFPILYTLQKKFGPATFLILCAVLTFGVRYLMLCVVPVNGNLVQGAFFVSRLMEFAAGMVLGQLARQNAARVNEVLFSTSGLLTGLALYALGVVSYRTLWSYSFADALTGIGLFIILAHLCRFIARHAAPVATGLVVIGTYSYGLYLIHQPYVLYFGERMESMGLFAFVALAAVIIAGLTLVSMAIEKTVNHLTTIALKRP